MLNPHYFKFATKISGHSDNYAQNTSKDDHVVWKSKESKINIDTSKFKRTAYNCRKAFIFQIINYFDAIGSVKYGRTTHAMKKGYWKQATFTLPVIVTEKDTETSAYV